MISTRAKVAAKSGKSATKKKDALKRLSSAERKKWSSAEKNTSKGDKYYVFRF